MAKYYSEIFTQRGNIVHRTGSKMSTHTRTWSHGIRVVCDEIGIRVYTTGGSNNTDNKQLIYEKKNEE